MSDPKRIEQMVAMLKQLWTRHPDLRFGQLVSWVESTMHCEDSFHVEDSAWKRAFQRCLYETDGGKSPAKEPGR